MVVVRASAVVGQVVETEMDLELDMAQSQEMRQELSLSRGEYPSSSVFVASRARVVAVELAGVEMASQEDFWT